MKPPKCMLCEEQSTVYRTGSGLCYMCARACDGHLDGIIHMLEHSDAVAHNIRRASDDFMSLLAAVTGVSPHGVVEQKVDGDSEQERMPGVR